MNLMRRQTTLVSSSWCLVKKCVTTPAHVDPCLTVWKRVNFAIAIAVPNDHCMAMFKVTVCLVLTNLWCSAVVLILSDCLCPVDGQGTWSGINASEMRWTSLCFGLLCRRRTTSPTRSSFKDSLLHVHLYRLPSFSRDLFFFHFRITTLPFNEF